MTSEFGTSGKTEIRDGRAGRGAGDVPPERRPTFNGGGGEFRAALRRRVDEYFQRTGKRRRGSPLMYAKAAIFLCCFALIYTLLTFVVSTGWLAVPLAVALGLSMAAIGFNIMHDGVHDAFSRFRAVNKAMGWSLDLIGGSSFLWRWKHVVIHHTYTNVTHVDTSIDLSGLGRVTPYEPWRPAYRWQHWYIWPLYGLTAIKWHLYDDFREVVRGRMGNHRSPRPRRWELVAFIAGKLVFFSLAFGIPLLIHPWWVVAIFYPVVAISLGLPLSIVTQLAHCVEPARFTLPAQGSARMESAWAVHQAESAVDFARRSRAASWLFGGLNFQIEHHLFPRISHVHYPALSALVEGVCREFGVGYAAYPSMGAGVAAHFHWLRKMGQPGPAVPTGEPAMRTE